MAKWVDQIPALQNCFVFGLVVVGLVLLALWAGGWHGVKALLGGSAGR